MSGKDQSRREFMGKLLKGSAATASYLALASRFKSLRAAPDWILPRTRVPNPYVNQSGWPYLVCVTGDNYPAMLSAGLSAIGGLGLLVNNNQDVLIKPNLVWTENYPTISDVNSVITTIGALQQVTTGAIRVGDAGSISSDRFYETLGYDPAIPQAGGQLVTFSDTYEVRRTTWPPEMPDFLVFSDVYDAPILINFCNLKRHNAAYLSCALKNNVGAVSGPQWVNTRDYLHSQAGLSDEFLQTVAEIAGTVNPDLHIVDARLIMTVTGPYQQMGGVVTVLNKLIICGDPVATDAYCTQLMAAADATFNPDSVLPTQVRAEELGMGTRNLSQVDVIEIDLTGVADPAGGRIPAGFALHPNHPNPFNASTAIRYQIPANSRVNLRVYDSTGRPVATLVNGWRAPGSHEVAFDASHLPSGVYLARLTAGKFEAAQRLVLLK